MHDLNQSSPSGTAKKLSPATAKQRRQFIKHLWEWSFSLKFRGFYCGFIKPIYPAGDPRGPYDLGQPIFCEIWPDDMNIKPTKALIRLFGPQNKNDGSRYRLIVRVGSGWEPEEVWFKKQYSLNQVRQKELEKRRCRGPKKMKERDSETVSIRPLIFESFMKLPVELQQHILAFAMVRPKRYCPLTFDGRGECASYPKR